MAILGVKILLPELLPEIQALQQQILDSFQPKDVEGLATRAFIKLIAPEWADQLALSAEANEKITREIKKTKTNAAGVVTRMIFSLSILNHPDVHLVPGVGLDFHPVNKTISKVEPLPTRPTV